MIDMQVIYGGAALLVVLLFAYLVHALLRAEEF